MSVEISRLRVEAMSLRLWHVLGSLLLVVALPHIAPAQQRQNPSTDELIKAIGLVRPAMSTAPDFNLLDANGRPVALSGFRGRWVLLNFWATWCAPCREEMPSMEQLSGQFSGELTVLAVNQRESAALVKQFMQAHNLTFPAPLDTTGRVAGYYRVHGIPVSYLIDGNGQMIGIRAGPMDWSSSPVSSVFRKLLGTGASVSIASEPPKPLPAELRARTDGIAIRAHHDRLSAAIGSVGREEVLTPIGKVSSPDEAWYMIKNKKGDVGWVRAAEVEEAKPRN